MATRLKWARWAQVVIQVDWSGTENVPSHKPLHVKVRFGQMKANIKDVVLA